MYFTRTYSVYHLIKQVFFLAIFFVNRKGAFDLAILERLIRLEMKLILYHGV